MRRSSRRPKRIAAVRDREVLEVEQRKTVAIAEQDRDIAVAEKRVESAAAEQRRPARPTSRPNARWRRPRSRATRSVDEARLERRRALEQLEVGRRQALDEAEIAADEEVERARIASERGLDEARVNRDRDLRRLEIERDQSVELTEIDKAIALLQKSKERAESQIEFEAARAKAVRAEEQVATARDAEIANRRREVELMLAQKDAEEQRIVVEVDRIRAAVEAEAQRLLNEAENVLTDEARLSVFRRNLLDKVEGIVRESVRPMEKIDGINILHVDGLAGAGSGGRNITDEVIDSALRYRVQAPLIDTLLGDIGMEGGSLARMGGLIREARDLDSIRRSAQAQEKAAGHRGREEAEGLTRWPGSTYRASSAPRPGRCGSASATSTGSPHGIRSSARAESRTASRRTAWAAFGCSPSGTGRRCASSCSASPTSTSSAPTRFSNRRWESRGYVATLRLTPVTDGDRTFAEWSAEFECDPAREAELVEMIGANVFQGGFDALEQHFGA